MLSRNSRRCLLGKSVSRSMLGRQPTRRRTAAGSGVGPPLKASAATAGDPEERRSSADRERRRTSTYSRTRVMPACSNTLQDAGLGGLTLAYRRSAPMFARPHATTAPAASFAYPLPRAGSANALPSDAPRSCSRKPQNPNSRPVSLSRHCQYAYPCSRWWSTPSRSIHSRFRSSLSMSSPTAAVASGTSARVNGRIHSRAVVNT